MTNPAGELCAFVTATTLEAIPTPVRDRLERGLIESAGAAIRGLRRDQPGGDPPGVGATPAEVAYRLGLATYDGDPISASVGELAITCGWTLPATLAAGAAGHRKGRDVLVAAAVGSELALRLRAVAGPALTSRGLDASATGMLGATAAAARLLAADQEQVGWALGIAACGTPTALLAAHRQQTTAARTFLAHASAQAVAATALAASGVRGLTDWLDPWFAALAPPAGSEPILDGLGVHWRLAGTDEPISVRLATAAAELARAARAASIGPADIDGVVVHGGGLTALAGYGPDLAGESASVPMLVARTLAGTAAAHDNRELALLHRRVQLAAFDDGTTLGLTLRTRDGRQLTVKDRPADHAGSREGAAVRETAAGRGDTAVRDAAAARDGTAVRDPAVRAAAVSRFREAAEPALGTRRAGELLDMLLRLPDLDDVSGLLAQLTPPPARAGRSPAKPARAAGPPRPADPESAALARFAATTRFADLPEQVVAVARRSVLDAIGCALYGRAARTVAVTGAIASATRPPAPGTAARVWHSGQAATAPAATLVNGTAIHTTELSESFTRAGVHPGTSVVPAVMAVAERAGATGQELVTAVAVGYETAIRLGLAFGGILLSQGLHSPTLAGAFGAAAGAARLLDLDPDAAGHALAITACRVPTAMWAAAFQHADIKDLFQAHGAALAVEAADLAAAGGTGPSDWLPRWFAAVPREPRLDALTETLGQFWWVSSGGLHFKDLPVMAMAAPTLGALRQILGSGPVPPERIERVTVASSGRITLNRTYPPESIISARGSIPFLVAAILHHPAEFLADPYFLDFITDTRIHDRRLDALAERVELRVDPRFDEHMERSWPLRFEARVAVRLDSGEILTGYDDTWQRTSTMDYDSVARKFRAMCRGVLGERAIDTVIERVGRLEELDSVREITNALAPVIGEGHG